MIIVDTSIWIDHLGEINPALQQLIEIGDVCMHPFVWGELLLGGLPSNSNVARQMQILPVPPVATATEAAAFIGWAKLSGSGIGYVDAHLLMSTKLLANGRVLTRDRRLRAEARRLGLAHTA